MKMPKFPFPTSRNNQIRQGAGLARVEESLNEIVDYLYDQQDDINAKLEAAQAAAEQAGEYAEEAFSGTPEGYEQLVSDVGDLKSAVNGITGGEESTIRSNDPKKNSGAWTITNATTGLTQRTSDSSYCSPEGAIDISMLKPGTTVSVYASLVGTFGAFLVDKNYCAIDYVNGNNATSKGYSVSSVPALIAFTVTEESKYILNDIRTTYWAEKMTNAYNGYSKGLYKKILDIIAPIESDVSNLGDQLNVDEDIIDSIIETTTKTDLHKLSSTIISGKYIASTGAVTSASSSQNQWEVTDYVDVSEFDQVAITAGSYTSRLYYAFYDSEKNYIANSGKAYVSGVVLTDEIVNVPHGAKYCVAMWYYSTSTNDPIIKGVIRHVKTNFTTPEHFGAKGDGVANDTQAFIDMLHSSHNTIVCATGKTYYITNTLALDNKVVNLNGCTIKSSAPLVLGDNNEIYNGTILQYGVTAWSIPAVAVEGENNTIRNIDFTGYAEGVFYVFTRKNSINTLIENCHFDGKPKMSIHVGGSKCIIRQCKFEESENLTLAFYSCHIKLDADNSADTTTPCSRDTLIEQCTFGASGDNNIDCFSGARGLIIRQCTFTTISEMIPAIEIKNFARNPNLDDITEGYSIAGLRECRDITIEDCVFNGPGALFELSSDKTNNVSNYIPIKGVTVRNCTGTNVDKDNAFGISTYGVENVILENLKFPAFTAARHFFLYGNFITMRNCNIYFGVPNCYGSNIIIQDCILRRIQPVGANTLVDIVRCRCSNTAGGFIYLDSGVNAGIVRVFECEGRNIEWLIQSNGKAKLLLAKNNTVVTLFNNDNDTGSGGYFFENFYTSMLSKTENKGIAEAINNYMITL